jgi:hypothetical protein
MIKQVMIKIVLVILMVPMFGCGSYRFAQDWSQQDTMYQGTFILLTLADWRQTHWMASHDWYWDGHQHKELMPLFLNDHPSTSQVDFLIPLGIISHTIISLALPPKYRRVWQLFFICVETGAIVNNAVDGVNLN